MTAKRDSVDLDIRYHYEKDPFSIRTEAGVLHADRLAPVYTQGWMPGMDTPQTSFATLWTNREATVLPSLVELYAAE